MAFEVFEVAVQMVGALREPLLVLERRDPDLARQVRRAGGDRIHLWRVAAPLTLCDRVLAMLWRLTR